MKRRKLNKPLSLFVVLLIYALAFMVGFWSVLELKIPSPLWQMAYANLIATVVIYFFSKFMDNSSLYDPYWSVAPILTVFYWMLPNFYMKTVSVYQWTGLALVFVWGLRLTLNWMLRWKGMDDEDWRYREIREKTKHWYWPVSLLGIHFMPTVMIFLGILPLYFIFETPQAVPAIGPWVLSVVILFAAIVLEAVADFQLIKFKDNPKNKKKLLQSGIWKKIPHPNYVGEMLFWWGVYLYAISFSRELWRLFLGPGLITLLFLFVSIPWMDKHLKKQNEKQMVSGK